MEFFDLPNKLKCKIISLLSPSSCIRALAAEPRLATLITDKQRSRLAGHDDRHLLMEVMGRLPEMMTIELLSQWTPSDNLRALIAYPHLVSGIYTGAESVLGCEIRYSEIYFPEPNCLVQFVQTASEDSPGPPVPTIVRHPSSDPATTMADFLSALFRALPTINVIWRVDVFVVFWHCVAKVLSSKGIHELASINLSCGNFGAGSKRAYDSNEDVQRAALQSTFLLLCSCLRAESVNMSDGTFKKHLSREMFEKEMFVHAASVVIAPAVSSQMIDGAVLSQWAASRIHVKRGDRHMSGPVMDRVFHTLMHPSRIQFSLASLGFDREGSRLLADVRLQTHFKDVEMKRASNEIFEFDYKTRDGLGTLVLLWTRRNLEISFRRD